MARSLGAKVNEDLIIADQVGDSDVEAFEALLAESIDFTTVTSSTTSTTTSETTITTTVTSASASSHTILDALDHFNYDEYTFEDVESSSECSGGDYTNRSSSEDDEFEEEEEEEEGAGDEIENEDDGDEGSRSSGSRDAVSGENRTGGNSKKLKKKKKRKSRGRPTTHVVAAKYGTVKVNTRIIIIPDISYIGSINILISRYMKQ